MSIKLIGVDPKDVQIMRTVCKHLYLQHHPEDAGKLLSDRILFNKITAFYADPRN